MFHRCNAFRLRGALRGPLRLCSSVSSVPFVACGPSVVVRSAGFMHFVRFVGFCAFRLFPELCFSNHMVRKV